MFLRNVVKYTASVPEGVVFIVTVVRSSSLTKFQPFLISWNSVFKNYNYTMLAVLEKQRR
jgi:hypothetical protein